MDYGIVFVFLAGGMLVFFFWYNATKGMIIEININNALYPKHYSSPKKFLKRVFNIRIHAVPKYLLFQAYLTLVYFFLGPLELLLYCCIKNGAQVAVYLLSAHYFLVLANIVEFLLISAIFKVNRTN